MARSLRSRTTHSIGLFTDAVGSPFAGRLLAGASEQAISLGHVLLVMDLNGGEAAETRAIRELERRQVDALIYACMGFQILSRPPVAELPLILATDLEDERRREQATGGMWFAPGESLLGAWDLDAAGTLDHPSLYAARLIERAPGDWVIVGFSDKVGGVFQGEILDPIPVVREGRALRLA